MIFGFYLLVLSILPNGDVSGEVLDYYADADNCFSAAIEMKRDAGPGVGFTCIEDVVEYDIHQRRQS